LEYQRIKAAAPDLLQSLLGWLQTECDNNHATLETVSNSPVDFEVNIKKADTGASLLLKSDLTIPGLWFTIPLGTSGYFKFEPDQDASIKFFDPKRKVWLFPDEAASNLMGRLENLAA
jgi:hypothetical protein